MLMNVGNDLFEIAQHRTAKKHSWLMYSFVSGVWSGRSQRQYYTELATLMIEQNQKLTCRNSEVIQASNPLSATRFTHERQTKNLKKETSISVDALSVRRKHRTFVRDVRVETTKVCHGSSNRHYFESRLRQYYGC